MVGAAQSHTLWEVMLVVGAVVVLLVALLMRRLVAFLKVFEARATTLLKLREQASANLAPVEQLASTGRAPEQRGSDPEEPNDHEREEGDDPAGVRPARFDDGDRSRQQSR